MVLMMAVIQIIPNHEYKKYFRFFSGLLLIFILMTPIMKVLDMEESFYDIYQSAEYKLEQAELETAAQKIQSIQLTELQNSPEHVEEHP